MTGPDSVDVANPLGGDVRLIMLTVCRQPSITSTSLVAKGQPPGDRFPDAAGFSLAATSKHQQDHPTTTTPPHVSLLIRWLDPSNAATTMPARKASNFKHGSTCGCATSRHLEGEHPQKFPSPSIC